MNDQELNRKVAEKAGWTERKVKTTHGVVRSVCPNYANDLNAIHELIKGLSREKQYQFASNLETILRSSHRLINIFDTVTASARDLCLAYLEAGE